MKKFTLIGQPITHSLSPIIHQAFARQAGIDLEYTLLDPGQSDFGGVVKAFVRSGGNGLNITVPFKQQAWELMDSCSNYAQMAQAVNTVTITSDGKLHGDNTDGIGFVNDMVKNHQFEFAHKRVLLLGAGGAAYGVVAALLQQRPAELIIASRNIEKAQVLCAHFAALARTQNVSLKNNSFSAITGTFDLIVNATSASLVNEVPAISATLLTPQTWCYDMVYNKSTTVFQDWAMRQGVTHALNGLGMLVEQAAEAFYLWHEIRPQTELVLKGFHEV